MAASHLPQMGQLISPRWIAVRNEILTRAKTDPQISYQLFVEICQRHDVNGNEIATLGELMHDLGQIVYYGEDEGLRNFVVLDPEWLTKAISYVLEDELTRDSGGILDHARLAEIWQDRPDGLAYPARYHPYFLRLMEKFDVSYRLEDDEYRSLVAQLVPHDRPDLPWDTSTRPPDVLVAWPCLSTQRAGPWPRRLADCSPSPRLDWKALAQRCVSPPSDYRLCARKRLLNCGPRISWELRSVLHHLIYISMCCGTALRTSSPAVGPV